MMTDALNHSLFLIINADPDTPAALVDAGILIAGRVIYLLPPMLAAIWLWGNSQYRNSALKALVVTAIALGCNQLIGIYMPTQRPFELGVGYTFLAHAPTPSFPSNHLTIFFSVGLCLMRGAASRLGVLVLISGLVVAWARVFVGIHFPLDMAGAVVVAIVVYAAVTPVWNRCGMTITTRLERVYRRIMALPISAGWLRE